MTILRRGVLLIAGLLWAGAALAQSYSPGENLIVQIPEGFALAHAEADGDATLEDYVREGEDLATWTELITLQLFPDFGGTSPEAFLEQAADVMLNECPEAELGTPQPVQAGAYPAALIVVICNDSARTEGIESFAMYAISGADRLYTVQYSWNRRPGPGDMADAQALFADVALCDTRGTAAPCPGR